MSAAPILNITKDGEQIKSVTIEGEAELGRSEGCLIRLDDRAISRKHALFTATPGGVQVEKKSDFAPLSVNGVECTRALLKEGDVIEIGPYLMRLAEQRTAAGVKQAPQVQQPVAEPAAAIPLPIPALSTSEPPTQQGDMSSAEPPSMPSVLDIAPVSPTEQSFDQGMPDLNFNQNPEEAVAEEAQPAAEPEMAANSGLVEIPSFEPSPEEAVPPIESSYAAGPPDEDAQTKLLPAGKLTASLEFASGVANVTHLDLEEEASIGRGKGCTVVLKDKKASRKHVVIRRQGSTFIIKDLDSANGTFVNGVQITELQLSGDDVIRIGSSEFEFKAVSQDYIQQQEAFLPVPSEELVSQPPEFSQPNIEMPFPPADPADAMEEIAGIFSGKKKKKQTLVDKFRALPKKRQMIVGGLLLVLFYFVFIDDDTPSPPKPTQKIVEKGQKTATFDALTEEQKKFVISEHDLAFDFYKNREYDKTLFELNKIFSLIPDYKDSRELERYSNEGKHKLEILEEERRKKEEEERLRVRVADLVDQTKGYMDKKQYDKAHDFFPQILALDPDNAMVAEWSKVVDAYEEKKAMEEQARQVQAQINRRAWDIYKEGMGLKKELKYLDAIETFRKVADIGATDKKLEADTQAAIQASISELAALRDPVLADAKQAEDNQDLPKAYQLYEKSTLIDPSFPTGFAGMARIRGVLHDRAKGLYIEAVLAESYSDFTGAKKKFQDCLQVAPKDDIYHERAERKLASYFLKTGDATPQ